MHEALGRDGEGEDGKELAGADYIGFDEATAAKK